MEMPRADRGRPLVVCDLGPAAYVPTWELQKRIQARLVQAKRREPPEPLPHVLLLVEHPPVYTLGKSGSAEHLLLDRDGLVGRGVAFHRIDRGGDITYHGPGQIVGYPILDLDRISPDIHRYLRNLEEVIIRTCADYGLPAGRVEGRTGVWVGEDGAERKICAMGIRCSRWVTMHGFAFNLNTDLSYFDHIVPCGIVDRGVTTLARELGHPIDEADARDRVVARFADVFEAGVTLLRAGEARAFLDRFAGPVEAVGRAHAAQ